MGFIVKQSVRDGIIRVVLCDFELGKSLKSDKRALTYIGQVFRYVKLGYSRIIECVRIDGKVFALAKADGGKRDAIYECAVPYLRYTVGNNHRPDSSFFKGIVGKLGKGHFTEVEPHKTALREYSPLHRGNRRGYGYLRQRGGSCKSVFLNLPKI